VYYVIRVEYSLGVAIATPKEHPCRSSAHRQLVCHPCRVCGSTNKPRRAGYVTFKCMLKRCTTVVWLWEPPKAPCSTTMRGGGIGCRIWSLHMVTTYGKIRLQLQAAANPPRQHTGGCLQRLKPRTTYGSRRVGACGARLWPVPVGAGLRPRGSAAVENAPMR
jgi:hypothetical protein